MLWNRSLFCIKPLKVILNVDYRIYHGGDEDGYLQQDKNCKGECQRLLFCFFVEQEVNDCPENAAHRVIDNVNIGKRTDAVHNLQYFKTCANEKTEKYRFCDFSVKY